MAEIIKYKANEVLPIIKHNMRHLPDGNIGGNESIQEELTKNNYSLIESRGKTCKEINQYRKEIEKEFVHKYNRKGLVNAVEIVVQRPDDVLTDEDAKLFFKECHSFIIEKFLGGEEKFCFVSEVHVDEKHMTPTGKIISHEHLHTLLLPAVKTDKFEGYTHKLSAHDLTSKKMLNSFHPELQAHLDKKGIKATVYRKQSNDGQTIGLNVKQLKEITAKTGIVIDKSMTVNELAEIISENVNLNKTNLNQKYAISELQKNVDELQQQLFLKDIDSCQQIESSKLEKEALKEKLQEAESENQKIKAAAQKIISEKKAQISELQNQLQTSKKDYEALTEELKQSKEQIKELEKNQSQEEKKQHTWEADSTWGTSSGWGTNSGWGKTNNKNMEVNV